MFKVMNQVDVPRVEGIIIDSLSVYDNDESQQIFALHQSIYPIQFEYIEHVHELNVEELVVVHQLFVEFFQWIFVHID